MDKSLRILHLEDDPDFADLVRALLAQDDLKAEVKRVGDRSSFDLALELETFDIILSDYHLPQFTGLEALAAVRKKYPHTPFILISGTIGENAAIESLKAGATDYVLKQRPERLAAAVCRAVQEAEERRARLEGETELIRREKYFRALTENSLDVLSVLTGEGVVIYKSASVKRVLGYEPEELIGQSVFTHIHPDDLPQVQKVFQIALAEPERTITLQFRYHHKNGSWRHLEAVGQNRLADPQIGAVVVNSRDVSDRLHAEENLRESEKHYRLLFQTNPNPMWVFDLETLSFLEVNEAATRRYGYSAEEFLKMKMTDIQPGKTQERGGFTSPEGGRGRIWKHRCKDGSFIDVEVIWSPMVFQGRFSALTMATDVTERLRIEHRNSIFSKLGYELSSATTPSEAAMIICEMADALFKWDNFAIDLYSSERDEVFSLLNIATVDGNRVELPQSIQSQTTTNVVKRVIQRGAELFVPDATKQNSATIMLAPIRKGSRVIGVLFIQGQVPGVYTNRDLETLQVLADHCGGALERLRAEQALRENQQRFRDLFENSPDAIFVEDFNANVLDVNPPACALHGLRRQELMGKNAVDDLAPANHREEARRDFQKLTRGELSRIEAESRRADGKIIPVEVRASRIQYDSQPAVLLHVRDITERRAAEAALRSSEILFRSVWENSADGMRLTDEDGMIVAVNGAYCKLVGLQASALEGKPFTVVYAESENHKEMLARHREFFRIRAGERKIEHRYTLQSGQTVTLEINDSFIESHSQSLLLLSLFRDVTLQRRLEEQLRQAQKMEAIGQLAGGVAHDFNNILVVIHGHASLLMASNLDDTAVNSAQKITQAAERAAGLTRQLLTFSRRQLIQPKKLDMNKIVGNMTDMLGRLLGEDIALQLNYSPSSAMIEADAGMMEQVLLNLAVNARDAMQRGGQLTVRISIVEINDTHVQRHPEARVGKFVCVSKSDTGSGISSENLSRIFEPFFTTKEVGKGTGLGLATVYGIVKQHQGWIEVESRIGKGTTFRVYIPYVGSEETGAEKPTTQITVRGGTETILLVEDERPVRELVARILQKYGYKVFQAGTGAEAIEIWPDHKEEIHLLLTDLIMPGNMNGRELAEKLWVERPELKVIFTSGYSADIVGKDFKLEPEVNFLQKPYHPQTLGLTVRRCLDGKQPS
jgi:PAS domain S-box-containing protein